MIEGKGIGHAVELFTESSDRWAAIDDRPEPEAMATLETEKRELIASSALPAGVAGELYPALGAEVAEIANLERNALAELNR